MKTTPEIVSFLKANVGLFAGFPSERLEGLVEGSRLASFEANEAIAHYTRKQGQQPGFSALCNQG